MFHLIEAMANGTGGPVDEVAIERAIAWVTYLEAHARRVYQAVTDVGLSAATALARHLRAGHLVSPFRMRTIQRKGWAGLTDKAVVLAGVEVLEDLHWVRRRERPDSWSVGGRPPVEYDIRPDLDVDIS